MAAQLKRILLVEDSPKDIELTLNALAECNLANQVDVVQDGQEALDYLMRAGSFSERSNGNPVVMLLDLKLPKIDGFEVLAKVRADAALQKLPVVILTSSREESDVARGYDLGVNAYVVKPLDFEQFISSVKTLGIFWAVFNEPPVG